MNKRRKSVPCDHGCDHGRLVTAEEMADSRNWREKMLMALTAVAGVRGEKVIGAEFMLRQDASLFTMQEGLAADGNAICLAGKRYRAGLGTYAGSEIRVKLPAVGSPFRRLTGLCGIQDTPDARHNPRKLVFSVEIAAGKEVWRNGDERTAASMPARFSIPLAGRREFILKVSGNPPYAHVNWTNLKVGLADGRQLDVGGSATATGFSFQYGGKPSSELLPHWRLTRQRLLEKDGVIVHRVTRTDPKTGLAVVCELKEYTRFPVVEWGLRFKNTSRRPTPLIENVHSLDIRPYLGLFPYLNYCTGDYCAPDGYEPFRVSLAHGEEYRFAPQGGRPTDRAWPYYNLEYPAGGRGMIVVVGWSGQWASSFRGLEDGAVHIAAGQELTHFRLHPDEEVRTPLSVLMFYRGDVVRSQNLWRRWMLAHNVPRPGGRLPAPILPAYTGRYFAEMALATEETEVAFMDRYVEEGIKPDYWWMDAGWYPCAGNWAKTGTWEVDAKRFPRGLRAVCDHAHAYGSKTLVWFEPERATPETWLTREHPEWLLTLPDPLCPRSLNSNRLLDLGNPKACRWLVDRVTTLIREQGIDLYRQDFNFAPLPYWRANDAPDRQGITEIRHVEGYLSFWKELRRRFPDMLLDSCASGGRRNDLETMRLSVPLHKTDYNYADLPVKQAFFHSLASWLPYFGAYAAPCDPGDAYAFRSSLAPMTMLSYDLRRRDVDWRPLRRLVEEWRTVASFYFGDYYPLTAYSRDERQWLAWQFHRPEKNDGMIQVFRRAKCPVASCRLPLRGLDAAAVYEVTVLGKAASSARMTGRNLLESGLPVALKRSPQAATVVYRKVALNA